MQHKSTDGLQEFVWRLKQAAERRGLSQVDIARQMNLKAPRVGNWFQGFNKPKPAERPILAALLAVDQDWLINGIGARTDLNSFKQTQVTPADIDKYTVTGSYIPPHAEDQAPYAVDAIELERELRRNFERLLLAADRDPGRLGWIREQFRQHLSEPVHWGMHARIERKVVENGKKMLAREAAEAKKKPSTHRAS